MSDLKFPYKSFTNFYIANQFQTAFAGGGDGDPLVEVTVNSKEETLETFVPRHLRPKNRPLLFSFSVIGMS